jgi:flagellar biosynthesis protein FlhF
MPTQKFVAPNMSEALRAARQKLGGDALIMSARDLQEGVEIIAISPADIPNTGVNSAPATKPATVNPPTQPPALQVVKPAPASLPVAAPAVATPEPSTEAGSSGLLAEVAELKHMLRAHLSQRVWEDLSDHMPLEAEALKLMLNAGFSPEFSAGFTSNLKLGKVKREKLLDHMQRQLERKLKVANPIDVFDGGGVFAFVGPTGVGKTTAIAKIAARCVLRYGRDSVALFTTDTFKIGAQEQLKVYAKIIGVPVVSLRDAGDLASKISDMSRRKIILLDTAGVSQREAQMLEQNEVLRAGGTSLKRILVMSSTTNLHTLEDVILMHTMAHKTAAGPAFVGSLITKTDEAAQLSSVVDCLIRHKLPLMFFSNGQRVPEDLNQANAAYLCYRALRPRRLGESLEINDKHLPALIADQLSRWTEG